MAYRGKLHASERRSLKRSLEPATAKAMSLGEGRLWRVTHRWGLMWHETNKKAATVGM